MMKMLLRCILSAVAFAGMTFGAASCNKEQKPEIIELKDVEFVFDQDKSDDLVKFVDDNAQSKYVDNIYMTVEPNSDWGNFGKKYS